MAIGWMLLALMTLDRSAAARDTTAYVTVESAFSTYTAKKIAGAVFRKAGITIVWAAPKRTLAGPPPKWLLIEVNDRTPDDRLPGALAVAHPFSGCTKKVTVFYDRVRSMAREREAELLAYVFVHEITHVIQALDHHSDQGLMKARWSAGDYAAIYERRLDFAREDMVLMRQGLAMGWCRSPEMLIDRSGSEIAVRQE